MTMCARTVTADQLPRGASLVLGCGAVAVGVALTLRPFTSLDALVLFVAASLILAGLGELLGRAAVHSAAADRLAGTTLIATGAVTALAPGLAVHGIAIVAGIGVTVSGGTRLVSAWQGESEDRYSSIVVALARVAFGILALVWPDTTILVIALLVGPVAIVSGSTQVLRALRSPTTERTGPRTRRKVWLRRLRATAALALALALVLISALVHRASPAVGSFYRWSARLPERPGVLLREQRTVQGMPPHSRGYKILYTTTGLDGRISPASGLVVVPAGAPSGSLPALLWEHGTTGVAQKCAPSALAAPFTAGAMFVSAEVLAHGWALVAPDYLGLGAAPPHPYLVGVPAARSALDAVRAARQVSAIHISAQTVVWGHSQGGGAALWTAIEAPLYAPDVRRSGIAALAPAADLNSLAKDFEHSRVGALFTSFMIAGYSSAYPDVSFNDYIRASARAIVRRIVGRCLSEPATLLSLPAVLTGAQLFSEQPTSGSLGARLIQNIPERRTGVPTLIAQGQADRLILASVQHEFADRLCKNGSRLEYRTYPGLDHVPLVEANSPLIPYLMDWTTARFKRIRAPSNCPVSPDTGAPGASQASR
jgi:uncharacterized membrane protein HdeD (DUF308 family)/pimeloyl-ACP methyl ester carboxylesterase